MSAVFLIRQRKSVSLISDTAALDMTTGAMLTATCAKCFAVPVLNAAVAFVGNVRLGAYFSMALMWNFKSFDDLIARGEAVLPRLFDDLFNEVPDQKRDFGILYFIGWHEAANAPGAYCMQVWRDGAEDLAGVIANTPGTSAEDEVRFKLVPMIIGGTPVPDQTRLAAAKFFVPANLEWLRPDRDLLRLLAVARTEPKGSRYVIGGKALLTTIDSDGVRQKVIHDWNDQLGEPLAP